MDSNNIYSANLVSSQLAIKKEEVLAGTNKIKDTNTKVSLLILPYMLVSVEYIECFSPLP